MLALGPERRWLMLGIGFAGTFAATLEARVRAQLNVPCNIIVANEAGMGGKRWCTPSGEG